VRDEKWIRRWSHISYLPALIFLSPTAVLLWDHHMSALPQMYPQGLFYMDFLKNNYWLLLGWRERGSLSPSFFIFPKKHKISYRHGSRR